MAKYFGKKSGYLLKNILIDRIFIAILITVYIYVICYIVMAFWYNPALVYLVLAIIAFLFTIGKSSILSTVVHIFFVLLWTWFLNFLCSKGHTGISWFLVVIPYVLLFLFMFLVFDVIAHGQSQPQVAQMPPQNQVGPQQQMPMQMPTKMPQKH